MDPRKKIREKDNLEGFPREQLTDIVIAEQERCKIEQQKRQEVEEELKHVRQKYNKQEDL